MFYNILVRNRDFVDAVRRQVELCGDGRLPALEEVIRRAIDGGAPHYYMSYETALRRTRELRHKGRTRLKEGSSRARRMWEEFFIRVETLLEGCPGMEIGIAVTRVLAAEPASGFFISVRQGLQIYHDHVRWLLPHLPAGTRASDTLWMLGQPEFKKLQNLYRQ